MQSFVPWSVCLRWRLLRYSSNIHFPEYRKRMIVWWKLQKIDQRLVNLYINWTRGSVRTCPCETPADNAHVFPRNPSFVQTRFLKIFDHDTRPVEWWNTCVVKKKSNRTQYTSYPCMEWKILANFVHRNVRKLLQSFFAENGLADAILTNYTKKTDSNKRNLYIELTGTMWIFEIAWYLENSLCHWRVN